MPGCGWGCEYEERNVKDQKRSFVPIPASTFRW